MKHFIAVRLAAAVALLFLLPVHASEVTKTTSAPLSTQAALQVAVLNTLAKENASSASLLDRRGCMQGNTSGVQACFDKHGSRFIGAEAGTINLELSSFGRTGSMSATSKVDPSVAHGRVVYAHNGITEWWRPVGPGYEQGFDIPRKPQGNSELRIVLTSNVASEKAPQGVAWGALRYGSLAVVDARGETVPATMTARAEQIVLAINDANAEYPLLVDPVVWTQQQKIVASDGVANDMFGSAVVIFGEKAFIGASEASIGSNSRQGAVYLFQKSAGTWTQTQKIVSSDGAALDMFGNSLAINQSTGQLVVGAYNKQVGTVSQAGTVYTFDNFLGTYIQTYEITAPDPASADHFGQNVSTYNNIIVTGTAYKTISGVPNAGKTYIYRAPSGGSYALAQTITTASGQEEEFGYNVLMAGNTIFIGAPYYQTPGAQYISGAVYIYNPSSSCPVSAPCWSLTQRIVPSVYSDTEGFSQSMASDGTTLLVGAPYYTPGNLYAYRNQGSVDVFLLSGGTWSQAQKLLSSDGGANDRFGTGLAMSGTTALIGAPRNLTPGAAYSFTSSGGVWTQSQEFVASDGAAGDYFGGEISMSGTSALISAQLANVSGSTFQGAAYFFGQ